MSSAAPCFFLAPTWDFPPPPKGPIKLGNVITSVKVPERALFTAPSTEDLRVFGSEQRQVSVSTERRREHQYGVFGKFLSAILGVGGDASVNWEKTIQTIQFLPTSEYLKTCIASQAVQRYLAKSRYRKPIFVITGLKIVTGAKAKSIHTSAVSGECSAEADLTPIGGVPVGVGPNIGSRKGDRKEITWESCNDIVYAYRVRKISVTKKDSSIKKDEDYKKGAMMDSGVNVPKGDSELIILSNGEADPESEGLSREEITDGGEVIICGIP
ncbi:hypothetical protein CFIO01_01676 [Colletotrichum fioriniae PJ7]|uniref:Uncharacterized protein n=1 Tax=Colletotrichum fioriniae PJ7 TaxID=1445577 RepID=A0A010QFY2_9PEZI|nr:hypothetical protein CFIO01_01676 [Colletotrichum fioriniae PJ7]